MVKAPVGSLRIALNEDRIGALIGDRGEVKKNIEERLKVKLKVDSKMGEVEIIPLEGSSLNELMKAKNVITAINHGFNPEHALKLAEDDMFLEIIDLSDYARNRNDLVRIKGRIIGERGKFWRLLEEMTGVNLTVYDKYVAIIGDYESVRVAREALMMIIEGRQHRTVINYLKREVSELKRRRLELWEKRPFGP